MKKELLHFKGLYGDDREMVFSNFLHHELLATRSKIYNWEIKEHVHSELFQLFLIENGTVTVTSSGLGTSLSGPCVVLIPSNTLHGFQFQPNIVGQVVTFSESYLENLFKNSPKILIEVSKLHLLALENNRGMFDKIKSYIAEIINESIDSQLEKQAVIEGLFRLTFIQLYRQISSSQHAVRVSDNRTLQYFQAFQKNIRNSINELKSVEFYAKELSITSVHLNRVCQSLVQKTALQVIHDYLILESKKYLLNTSYTVAEIAYLLNFSEPAYFTKFFKKHTGVTPTEFREV